MSQAKKKKAAGQNRPHALVIRVLTGFAVGMIFLLLLLAIFAWIIVKSDLNGASVYLLGLLAGGIASFVAGFFVTRPFHRKGLPFGVLAALPLIAAVSAMALIANRGSAGVHFYILVAVMLLCGALGGICAANLRKFK